MTERSVSEHPPEAGLNRRDLFQAGRVLVILLIQTLTLGLLVGGVYALQEPERWRRVVLMNIPIAPVGARLFLTYDQIRRFWYAVDRAAWSAVRAASSVAVRSHSRVSARSCR